MTFENTPLEKLLEQGKILEIGEVKIEEEEQEIPIDVAEDESIAQGYPELVFYTGGPENTKPVLVEEPANAPLFAYAVKAEDAQKKLRNLASILFSEPGRAHRLASAFGITTERDRISAFGTYFADFLGNEGYINPALFLVKAEVALVNLKSEKEGNKPIRKSIREVLSGKDEKVYGAIRERLPEIARAVATTGTGFAVEVRDIYRNAEKAGKTPFEYALDLRRERQLEALTRQANYGLYR